MIVFTVRLDSAPPTGDALGVEVQKALLSVDFNIGPEPLRLTTGPIYGGNGDGTHNQRTGTWEIADGTADEGPLADGDNRRLPYIAKHTSVLQGSHHIALARSKTMAKRISNALNKHTPNDEGV